MTWVDFATYPDRLDIFEREPDVAVFQSIFGSRYYYIEGTHNW